MSLLYDIIPILQFHIFTFDQRLCREINVRSMVRHRHITPFLGISLDFDRPHTPFPFYRHGAMPSYVRSNPNVNKYELYYPFRGWPSYLNVGSACTSCLGLLLLNDRQ